MLAFLWPVVRLGQFAVARYKRSTGLGRWGHSFGPDFEQTGLGTAEKPPGLRRRAVGVGEFVAVAERNRSRCPLAVGLEAAAAA